MLTFGTLLRATEIDYHVIPVTDSMNELAWLELPDTSRGN